MRFLYLALLIVFVKHAEGQVRPYEIRELSVAGFKLSVFVPAGYDTARKYRVLYFNDGQSLFGPNSLDVDKAADELVLKGLIEPVIVVGIHSDRNRTSNYVPYADETIVADEPGFYPAAAAYSKKIITRIIPFVEENFAVSGADRGIAGYSFGGLHSTWMALHYPELFRFSGSLSPSYWVSDFRIFKEGPKAKEGQVFYFDIGTGEWNYYVPMIEHLRLPLLKSVFYFEDFGAHHTIADWRGARVKNILLLFAGTAEYSKSEWEPLIEIIRSEYSGKIYPRVNPVIHYENGLIASASYAATFSLKNNKDGLIRRDGSFEFLNKNDLIVSVTFKGETKDVTAFFSDYEKLKNLTRRRSK